MDPNADPLIVSSISHPTSHSQQIPNPHHTHQSHQAPAHCRDIIISHHGRHTAARRRSRSGASMLQSTPAPAPTLSHSHSHSHNSTAHDRRRRRRHRCHKRRKRRRYKLRYRRRRLVTRRISPAPHRDRHHSREVVQRPAAAVTVDLVTQDASQLSCTGSNDDACELVRGRVLEETAGEEKGDPVGRPVGEGVFENGPQESVSSRFWAASVGCFCASAVVDGETWRILAR